MKWMRRNGRNSNLRMERVRPSLERPSPMIGHQTSTTPHLTCEVGTPPAAVRMELRLLRSPVQYRKGLFFYAFQAFPAWPRRSPVLSVVDGGLRVQFRV